MLIVIARFLYGCGLQLRLLDVGLNLNDLLVLRSVV